MRPEIALTIAGSDSGGGAGVQADLKTFSALEVHGVSVITSVTAQNSREVKGTSDIPSDFVGKQIDTVVEDYDVKWCKTGMLSNSEIIERVQEKISEHEIEAVVDPVMIAATGAPLIENDAFDSLKEFLKGAELVTPNIVEAEKLSGENIEKIEDMEVVAKKIVELGPKGVLIKGGHLNTPKIHNLLYYKNEFEEFEEPRVDIPDVHGTGCTFSAAIAAELAKGETVKSAVKKASEFMVDAIRGRLNVGKGVESVNPMARVWKVTSGDREIEEVQRATKKVEKTEEFGSIIPEVGTNIAMGEENAKRKEQVVGLTGRIVKVRGKPFMTGIPDFGGSEHVANIVLSAMKENPKKKAAMNIKFSKEILEKCRELGLSASTFDRNKEPEEAKTMRWGTKRAIEKFGKVPDIIYDRGGIGKEPMIRILGETATEVSKKALKIARKLH